MMMQHAGTPLRSVVKNHVDTPRSCTKPASAHKVQQKPKLDRFITNRAAMDLSLASFRLQDKDDSTQIDNLSPSKEYQRALAESLLPEAGSRILAYKNKAPAPPEGFGNRLAALYNHNHACKAKKAARTLPSAPERILDAPDLVDDFYINVLDWSSSNVVAVALGRGVYLWNANDGTCNQLTELQDEDDYVSSVAWAGDGKHIAVGTASNTVQLWDVARSKQVRNLRGHTARVSAAAWHGAILSTGGRDSCVLNHDVRIREHVVSTFKGHAQEVCSLKWSSAGQLASGGNDNKVCIWSLGNLAPSLELTAHQAAVKAMAWAPFQSNLLATGGGSADRTIKFHNTSTGALLNSVDAESQVSALAWNPHDRELVSSHGFSKFDIKVWRYPTMAQIGQLTGHTQRILHMALSPDGTTVCSAAADESLRFFRCFAAPASASGKAKVAEGIGSTRVRSIR